MHIQYDFDRRAFGGRLRTARIDAGYHTEIRFSEVMNASSKYISKLENGTAKPSLEYVLKFAEVTNADMNYVLLGKKREEETPVRFLKDGSPSYGRSETQMTEKEQRVLVEAAKLIQKRFDV